MNPIERSSQADFVGDLLKKCRSGHGGAVLVTGAEGQGKTEFLNHVAAFGEEYGALTLAASCSRLERGIPLGALGQLLSWTRLPADLRDDATALIRAGRDAAQCPPVGSLEPVDVPPELLEGFQRILARLTEHTPVIVKVDDVHDIDRVSLQFLVYAMRRLHSVPLLMLLAERENAPPAPSIWSAEPLRQGHLHRLRLTPLSRAGVEQLLLRADPRLDPGLSADIHRVSGGNPLLVHALIADQHAAPGRVDGAVTVGPHYQEAVTTLLHRVEPALTRTVQGLALLPSLASATLLDRLLEVPAGTSAQALTTLHEVGLVHAGEFRHPQIRAALLADLAGQGFPPKTRTAHPGWDGAEAGLGSAPYDGGPGQDGSPGRAGAVDTACGVGALSDAERRVAELAARGHTNREISRKLFITVSTVEQHLTRAYRKLGVTDRRGLPDDLEGDELMAL
ncbi:AAA family ATPase [Nocardiopsis sediminis]|uniref:AAA family ATPase n=1 Tax=Nocardiopsis sediminis TaxID=1778267 RepID=A0ABV8FI62_9ACTN